MGIKKSSSNAHPADQRWRDKVPDASSSFSSGRIPACWYPGNAARKLHLPHLALPQALAWDVHTLAYRTSGQRIDLFGPALMMPCLRQPPKGHCGVLLAHVIRLSAPTRGPPPCIARYWFAGSGRLRYSDRHPFSTQQAPDAVEECVGGCRRA